MFNLINCSWAAKCLDAAPLLLRLAAGSIFLAHGWQKYQMGVAQVAGFLTSLSFPAPEVMAVLLIGGEILGGGLMILGLYTRSASAVTAFIALVAMFSVHFPNGFFMQNGGYEFTMLLLAASLSLVISGAGKYSLDAKLNTGQA